MPTTNPTLPTPQQWLRIATLLDELLALPAEQRARVLRERAEDALVRAEVESLLGYAERPDALLDHPPGSPRSGTRRR